MGIVFHNTFRMLILLAGLLCSASVFAATLTSFFGGHIFDIPSGLEGTFDYTDSISGYYSVDTSVPPTFPDNPARAHYAMTDFSVTVGSYTATFNAGNGGEVRVADDVFVGEYFAGDGFFAFLAPDGPPIGNHVLVSSNINDEDPTGAAFDSTALPLTIADLAGFCCLEFNLTFREEIAPNSFLTRSVRGQITSFESVPLPAALPLFLSGLVLLAPAVTRGRRQNGKG